MARSIPGRCGALTQWVALSRTSAYRCCIHSGTLDKSEGAGSWSSSDSSTTVGPGGRYGGSVLVVTGLTCSGFFFLCPDESGGARKRGWISYTWADSFCTICRNLLAEYSFISTFCSNSHSAVALKRAIL